MPLGTGPIAPMKLRSAEGIFSRTPGKSWEPFWFGNSPKTEERKPNLVPPHFPAPFYRLWTNPVRCVDFTPRPIPPGWTFWVPHLYPPPPTFFLVFKSRGFRGNESEMPQIPPSKVSRNPYFRPGSRSRYGCPFTQFKRFVLVNFVQKRNFPKVTLRKFSNFQKLGPPQK